MINQLKDLKPYYVYVLIDGLNDEVFYVGKGHDDRLFQHHKEVQRGKVETAKQKRIADIEHQNGHVRKTVICRFDSEQEAFAVESILIHWVYGHSQLTNVASGHGVEFVRSKGDFTNNNNIDQSESRPYYVYLLTDANDHAVFYVGKGKGERAYQHIKEVEQGACKTRKQQKIIEINSGSKVEPVVLGRYRTDKEAYAVEGLLIHWVYGIDSLTNDVSGHRVETIRTKGHYEVLQGIDEPELNYCERTKANRERNDIIGYLSEIKELIEAECGIEFDGIHTHNDRHTYLVKFIKGVRLTVACHHTARRAAAVTIESLDTQKHNKAQVRHICDNSRLEWKDNGRYGRIMPAGTYSDPKIILEKFKETLAEIEKVKI